MYRGILFGAGEQVWYNSIFSLVSTFRYAGALAVLVWIAPTLQAFFIWQVVASLFSLCLLALRLKHCLPPAQYPKHFSLAIFTDVKSFATGMMAIGVATILLLQLDKIVLSSIVTLKNLGYYTLASTAANIMFMAVVPITQALYPSLVTLSSGLNQEKLITLFRKITQAVAIVVANLTMVLAFFSGGVIFAWSGNLDLVNGSASLLTILVAGSFFNCLSHLPFQLQTAFGKTKLLLKIYIFSVLLFCPLLYTCVLLYGVQGAAWAWFGSNLIHLIITVALTHGVLITNHKWSWYIADVLVPSVTALLVVFCATQVQPVDYSRRLHWLAFLIITGLLSLTFSIIATPMIRHSVLALIKIKQD